MSTKKKDPYSLDAYDPIEWDALEEFDRLTNESGNDFECFHDWVHYTGLNITFEYCSKCDIKREDENL